MAKIAICAGEAQLESGVAATPSQGPSAPFLELIPPYRRAFVSSHYPPFIVSTQGKGWHTEKRGHLTDGKVSDHLAGQYYVGTIPRHFTHNIALDLDNHDKRSARTLDRRTEQARQAFGEAAPLAFSTPSGGRHLYYLLSGPAWSDRARAFAVDKLQEHGLELQPGQIEVYPDGGRALRLPLGRDCWLLDPDTLLPVDGHRDANLHTLQGILADHRYDTLEIPPGYRATERPQEAVTGRRRASGRSVGEFMEEVDRLLRDGLWMSSQRNRAFLKLTWFMRVIWGFDAERTEGELWAWIQQYHNGYSREYQASPDKVRRKVRDIVQAFKPEKVGTGRKGESCKAAERPAAPRSAAGAAIEQYVDAQPFDNRERAFLWRVLDFAHRHGQPTLDGQLEVQIPSRTLKWFHWQYGPMLKLLISQGCIELSRNYGAQVRRCKTYRVPCLDKGLPHCS